MVKNTMPAPQPWMGVSKFKIEEVDFESYYRVYAVGEIEQWIRQQPISQWKYDRDDNPMFGRAILLVVPELVTLLKLKWA